MNATELAVIVNTVIRSPVIKKYNVGITVDSPARRSGYLGVGFDHYIVLDFKLSCLAALQKEKELFELLTKDKRSIAYRKYRDGIRDAMHRPSTGGIGIDHDRKYDLYLAWWNNGSRGYRS
jgi:hypothetical protein